MLVCDSNVRGIRERNKLGLIITSADVNPYKNKSSLLFFSPPPTDQTTWAGCSCPDRRSSSTRVLNTSPVRCRHAECRSSVSLSPLISQRNVWSKTDFTDGAVSHTKKKSWTHSEVYIYSVLPYVIQSCEGDSTVKTTDTSDECSFWDFFF